MKIVYRDNFLDPEYIIVHHSATSSSISLERSLLSFNASHKARFPTQKSSLGYNIAYHFIIAKNGKIKQTREVGAIGYHAGNYSVNLHSIGICLIGNFNKEKPSSEQENSLRELLLKFKNEFDIKYILPHRRIKKSTDCYGKLLSDDWAEKLTMLDELVRDKKGGFYFIKRGDNGKQKIDTKNKGVGGMLTILSRAFGVETVSNKFLKDKEDKKYF